MDILDNRTYFITKDSIRDSLLGLAALNPDISLYDFGNVVARKDHISYEGVKIVSGGGSGNEPAFASYVGKGMLTAAIQGERGISPSCKQIMRLLRELSYNHTAGILIIVQGSCSNLLNFGVAMERVLDEGLRVRLLAVTDHYNNINYAKTRKRGLTGVILIIKIAAAMSEAGHSLAEIYDFCVKAEKQICSISLALKVIHEDASVNGICEPIVNIDEGILGVGLNGERGNKRIKLTTSRDTMETIINEMLDVSNQDFQLNSAMPVIVILNNMQGITKIEELVFIKDLTDIFQAKGIEVLRFMVGHYLTSFNSIGLVLTVLRIFDTKLLEYMDFPCSTPGWPNMNQVYGVKVPEYLRSRFRRKDSSYLPIKGPKLCEKSANILLVCVQFACNALISCEKQLNCIDAELGDADTGTRFRKACDMLNRRIKEEQLVLNCPSTFFSILSRLFEVTLGGTMGCIYSILFQAAANTFAEEAENATITPLTWLKALENARDALKTYGKVDFGEKTMFDPIEACIRSTKEAFDQRLNFIECFSRGVTAAENTAENTKLINCKFPDPGAHAVGIWMRAVIEGVKLRCIV